MLSSVIRRQLSLSRASCFLLQSSCQTIPSYNELTSQCYQYTNFHHQPLYIQQNSFIKESRYNASDILLLRRNYTSSANNSPLNNNENKENQKAKKLGIFQKFRYIVNIFWSGCKALFQDVRLAFQTRRKLGLYHVQDFSRLTREELRHMRQVYKM